MTSKEAFEKIIEICRCYHRQISDVDCKTVCGYPIKNIEKDLEVLDCFRKIPKRELKEFIENEIILEENYNTWLASYNCDLGKERSTEHLIKIKEWLENEN